MVAHGELTQPPVSVPVMLTCSDGGGALLDGALVSKSPAPESSGSATIDFNIRLPFIDSPDPASRTHVCGAHQSDACLATARKPDKTFSRRHREFIARPN